MDIPALDAATLAAVRAKHAHRFPQSATLRAPADRGAGTIEIPIVIGNPSGACKMPPGDVTRTAWAEYVRPALTGAQESPGLARDLALDVVLWPDGAIVDQIFGEWAALSMKVAELATRKSGGGIVSDPITGEEVPACLVPGLAGRPRAVWRRVRPARGDAFALLVEPPDAGSYAAFADVMASRTGAQWKAVREFVASCVPEVYRAGLPVPLDALLDEFPGVAISLAKDAASLGGIAAEAELGE